MRPLEEWGDAGKFWPLAKQFKKLVIAYEIVDES
jgi:hypothetical protein